MISHYDAEATQTNKSYKNIKIYIQAIHHNQTFSTHHLNGLCEYTLIIYQKINGCTGFKA